MFTRFLSFSLLLLGLSAFGQAFTPLRPFVFASSASTSSTPPQIASNLFRWWVASDVANGISVTNWYDRIVSEGMSQLNTNKPTNSASGMYFNGTAYLTNGSINAGYSLGNIGGSGEGDTLFFIFQPDTVSGTRYITSDKQFMNRGPRMVNALLRYQGLGGALYTVGTCVANGQYDVVATWLKVNDSTWILSWYTNGFLAKTNITATDDTTPFNVIGGNITVGDLGLHGYLRELGIYTNNPISANLVSNIHYYATNTYLYSP